MDITLKLFGQLRHLADQEEMIVGVEDDTTVEDVLMEVSADFGDDFRNILFDEKGMLRPSMMVLLNDTPVDKSDPTIVDDGDTLTVLPAIAGG